MTQQQTIKSIKIFFLSKFDQLKTYFDDSRFKNKKEKLINIDFNPQSLILTTTQQIFDTIVQPKQLLARLGLQFQSNFFQEKFQRSLIKNIWWECQNVTFLFI